jgi:hypothetical protein
LGVSDRLDLLLPRRFLYGTGSHERWAERLSTVTCPATADTPLREAFHVLHDTTLTAEALLERVLHAHDLVATAAAHRLLSMDPNAAATLFRNLGRGHSPDRLLAAAAFIPHLDPEDLTLVHKLIRQLLARFSFGRRSEALTQLLDELPAGLDRKRLFLLAAAKPGPLWPFFDAYQQVSEPDDQELSALLIGGEKEDQELALRSLGGRAYWAVGKPQMTVELDPAAAKVLLELCRDRSVWEAEQSVVACTNAGLVDFLPDVIALLDNRSSLAGTATGHTSIDGAMEYSPLAAILACIGYLGREAHVRCSAEQSRKAYEAPS